jgi:hypothetical protein
MGRGYRCGSASPDQASARLFDYRMLKTNSVFEVFKVMVIEVELTLEDTIRNPTATPEHGNGLVEYLLECHAIPFCRFCDVNLWYCTNERRRKTPLVMQNSMQDNETRYAN